jgi:hypothetical protein
MVNFTIWDTNSATKVHEGKKKRRRHENYKFQITKPLSKKKAGAVNSKLQ